MGWGEEPQESTGWSWEQRGPGALRKGPWVGEREPGTYGELAVEGDDGEGGDEKEGKAAGVQELRFPGQNHMEYKNSSVISIMEKMK